MPIAKWGFGMAPISKVMGLRYENAVIHALQIIDQSITLEEVNIDYISELKGMFNRGLKQDQWDWFTVNCKLGSPPNGNAVKLVKTLVDFRESVKNKNWEQANESRVSLTTQRLRICLLNYLGKDTTTTTGDETGLIYILSTRELPKTLKIGMTTRSVSQRVKEINSATGVLYPYSARKIFRVKNAKVAEFLIFEVLKEFRIREDREFFELEFSKAVNLIVNTLLSKNLISREKGVVKWFNAEKGFGFISSNEGDELYFNHETLVNTEQPMPGAIVEFDISNSLKGPKAVNVYVAPTQE